jgi:dethiobiotin synthetase
MKPIFISGIGTGIGKTLVAAIITEALKADYWKPVQAGFDPGTDSEVVASLLSNPVTIIHPETYLLRLAASPHIAAQKENRHIQLKKIANALKKMDGNRPLVIEGAGGLMVPLNEQEFVIDLVKLLNAKLVLVSRNYLGSINHSLMTAELCHKYGLNVAGWVFNDHYLNYEYDIAHWSGYPVLFSVPPMNPLSKQKVLATAESIPPEGMGYLYESL